MKNHDRLSKIRISHPLTPVPILVCAALVISILLAACSATDRGATADFRAPDELEVTKRDDEAAQELDPSTEPASLEPSGEGLSSAISGIDPCELLTAEELETAFGEPPGKTAGETIFTYKSCNFESQSGSKFIILQVSQQNAEQFTQDNEETSAMFDAELMPISSLGDDAAYYSGFLRVRSGNIVIQFATWHTEGEQDQALALTQELARLVLQRIP